MKNSRTYLLSFILLFALCVHAESQVQYPYPVERFPLLIENQRVGMAYMDIKAGTNANGRSVLLLHGKNFNGYYWKDVIPFLTKLGFRVIVPDQVGWGKSDHPDIHYSFHLLAANTKALLDSLGISKTIVIGHSMGGMLATRFVLMYPQLADKLILENPIGLEDYKTFVPYQPLDSLFKKEKKATYESYKKYQQSYYPVWKPEYEQYVAAQASDLQSPDFDKIAWTNAITYQMIYEQPVVYEFARIKIPVLLVIGQLDRTIVGKDQLSDTVKNSHGQYPLLGKKTQQQIKNARLQELPGIGHIPHVQDLDSFKKCVEIFLK